jgi:hypothetical protein
MFLLSRGAPTTITLVLYRASLADGEVLSSYELPVPSCFKDALKGPILEAKPDTSSLHKGMTFLYISATQHILSHLSRLQFPKPNN